MSNLRTSGPVGNGPDVNAGEDAFTGQLFNATAKCHPDHESPENKQTQELAPAPPKGNLGHQGTTSGGN